MPFTDEQPFLDAIFARYHDDGPRLVYADFLDDAGDPARAELARVQIALAHLPDDHPRKPELANRQAELIDAHSAQWTEHLRDLDVHVWFRRGVPDSVAMYAGAFLSEGEELFRRLRVRRLRLQEAACVLPKLIHCPLLARVRELDLCSEALGNAGVSVLARSPFLKDLDSLDLGFNGLDDSGITALARTDALAKLTALTLNDNGQITAEGVKSLAESPFFGGLTALDVSGNDVSDAGVRAVVTSKVFARLHTFRLSGNHIGDTGVTLLVRSALFGRMLTRSPRLELRANSIGPGGAAAVAASPALARCTTLDLTGNYLGDAGFASVLDSRHLTKLHTLKLGHNQITDAGLMTLRDRLPSLFARLRVLDLSGNRLTRFGLGLLESARGEARTLLDVSGNVQTSAGGEAPVPVGRVVPEVLRGVTEVAQAAELRRRVAHPTMRPENPPNPTG